MTPDQPAAPAGLHPETAVICGGLPGHAASESLNVPVVLASNFHAGSTGRTATPTPAPTPPRAGRCWRQPWARWRAVTPWRSPPAWPPSPPCSTSCRPAAASSPPRTATSGSASFSPTPPARPLGRRPRGPDRHRSRLGRRRRRDLLWLETPSNPLLEVADLPALCAAGRRAGAIVGVDNTFATPLLQQPLALGADLVVHSAKFIGGHSDLLSGITIAREQALAGRLRQRRGLSGATPGALEAFLALRGLRALALRLSLGCRADRVVEAV